MRTCRHACVHACVRACMRASVRGCVRMCMCVAATFQTADSASRGETVRYLEWRNGSTHYNTSLYVGLYTCLPTHLCMHMSLHVPINVSTHMSISMLIHLFTRVHTHVYTDSCTKPKYPPLILQKSMSKADHAALVAASLAYTHMYGLYTYVWSYIKMRTDLHRYLRLTRV